MFNEVAADVKHSRRGPTEYAGKPPNALYVSVSSLNGGEMPERVHDAEEGAGILDEDETSFTKKDLDFYNIHSLLELSTTVNLAQAMAQTEYSFALATQQSINQARNYSDVADEEKELRAMQKRLTDVDWNLLAYKKLAMRFGADETRERILGDIGLARRAAFAAMDATQKASAALHRLKSGE